MPRNHTPCIAVVVAIAALAACGGSGPSREEAANRAAELLRANGIPVRDCWMDPALDNARAFAYQRYFCEREGGTVWCSLATDTDDSGLPTSMSNGIRAENGCT
jgi:hypothetical protein